MNRVRTRAHYTASVRRPPSMKRPMTTYRRMTIALALVLVASLAVVAYEVSNDGRRRDSRTRDRDDDEDDEDDDDDRDDDDEADARANERTNEGRRTKCDDDDERVTDIEGGKVLRRSNATVGGRRVTRGEATTETETERSAFAREATTETTTAFKAIDVKHTRDCVKVYESLELAFAMRGLDARAISPRKFFDFATFPEAGVWPRKYSAVSGVERDCARLVILSLEDAPAIAAAVQQSTRELLTMLGGKMDAFAPGRMNLHVSIFHLSRTHEYVKPPVAFAVDDAVREGTKRLLPHVSSSAPSEAIKYEESAVADALYGVSPVTLEVDRVCVAPSGCLLLCFNDVKGDVQIVRERLRDNAIGAARGQNETVHCTLARLFPKENAPALDEASVRDINSLCTRWTARLRGSRMVARSVVYVVEERFGFCDGHRTSISLAAAAGGA